MSFLWCCRNANAFPKMRTWNNFSEQVTWGHCLIQRMRHFRVTPYCHTAPVRVPLIWNVSCSPQQAQCPNTVDNNDKSLAPLEMSDTGCCFQGVGQQRPVLLFAASPSALCHNRPAPSGLQCPVMYTVATRFGFPCRSFPLNANHSRPLSLFQAGSPYRCREYEAD